jgi:hypothetical protein
VSWSVISFSSFVVAALLVTLPRSRAVAAVPAASIAEASAHGSGQPDLPDHLAISVGAQMGVGHSPYPAPEAHTISGLLTAFIFEGEARVRPAMAIQLRLPLVLAGVDQPAGGAHASNTLGHPEAAFVWRPWTSEAAALFTRLGLALPIGGGNAALGRRPLENQTLSLASALHAWREEALFAPGRLSLTASARGEAAFDLGAARRWRLDTFGEIKVPAMIAVDRGTTDPRAEVHTFALSTVVGGGAALSWSRLRLGVAPWLAFHVVPAAEIRGQPASRWAHSLVPDLTVRITGHVGLSVGASVPLGGALDGSTAVGLQAAGAW